MKVKLLTLPDVSWVLQNWEFRSCLDPASSSDSGQCNGTQQALLWVLSWRKAIKWNQLGLDQGQAALHTPSGGVTSKCSCQLQASVTQRLEARAGQTVASYHSSSPSGS